MMTEDFYFYRNHLTESLRKRVNRAGLKTYCATSTEWGQLYRCFYKGRNLWWDQEVTAAPEYRLFVSTYSRPTWPKRTPLRFLRTILIPSLPIQCDLVTKELYFDTGTQPQVLVLPDQIECFKEERWVKLLEAFPITQSE